MLLLIKFRLTIHICYSNELKKFLSFNHNSFKEIFLIQNTIEYSMVSRSSRFYFTKSIRKIHDNFPAKSPLFYEDHFSFLQ